MLNLSVYNFSLLQSFKTFLNQCESEGITDIKFIRERIERHVENTRKLNRVKMSKAMKEKAVLKKQDQKIKKNTTIYQGHILCPDCKRSNLVIKELEGVTYTACPSCHRSVEFK